VTSDPLARASRARVQGDQHVARLVNAGPARSAISVTGNREPPYGRSSRRRVISPSFVD